MAKIDLEKILAAYSLDKKEVALHLFPDNKYPDLAIRRVVIGEALLDSEQVSKLASLAGVSISELFSGERWKINSRDNNVLKFETGDYTAELNLSSWTTKVFHKGSMFHDEILHHRAIPLSEYFETLNEIIVKKEFAP